MQQLGKNLGLEPIGNPGYASTWITGLLSSGARGIEDCENGVGLKRCVPTLRVPPLAVCANLSVPLR
ncbi:hypothetical protein [Fortiea contorta]|uniref:hypothetical protein n=1 Tax=Fortiea contorta TaxID=1892405 RepID=UPI0014612FD2|nr:hypothetical protein [Fortiea contorta]